MADENKKMDVLYSYAEPAQFHNHYLIYEIGKEKSRLSVFDGNEELYEVIINTPKDCRGKILKLGYIEDELINKLVLKEAA